MQGLGFYCKGAPSPIRVFEAHTLPPLFVCLLFYIPDPNKITRDAKKGVGITEVTAIYRISRQGEEVAAEGLSEFSISL